MRVVLVFHDHIESMEREELPEPVLTLWTDGQEHRFAKYSQVSELSGAPIDVVYIEVGQRPDDWEGRLAEWLREQAIGSAPSLPMDP